MRWSPCCWQVPVALLIIGRGMRINKPTQKDALCTAGLCTGRVYAASGESRPHQRQGGRSMPAGVPAAA